MDMSTENISSEQVKTALAELGELADKEYGLTLKQLLEGPKAEQRLQRLAGVLLKKPFAQSHEPDASYNPTDAKRSWHWGDISQFDDQQLQQTGEYNLLKQLRDAGGERSWKDLQGITHEAGLFYVLGRWIDGKLKGDERTFRDYYYDKKSPEVDFVLNVANLLPVASVLAGVVGVPVLAVNLALIVTKFGYEKVAESPAMPDA
jgi:hypothetical protein